MLNKITKFLFVCMVVVLIIDPSDRILHLKIPLFLGIFMTWLSSKISSKLKYRNEFIFVIITLILIALFGIISAFVQNSEVDFDFSLGFMKSLLLLILLIVVMDQDFHPDKYLNKYAILIPIITIPLYLIAIYNPLIFSLTYNYLVLDKGAALMAYRNFYGYHLVMIYYKTSPILVFPLAYYAQQLINNKKTLLATFLLGLYAFSLIISGTRANIISVFIILLFFMVLYLKQKRNAIYTILASVAVFSALFIFAMSLSFEEKERSAQVKSGHFKSFYNTIFDNPEYLLWGQGLGSRFYSSGSNAYVSQTELTYFELIRYFGLPLALLFIFVVCYPLIDLISKKKITEENVYLIPAFLSYLFISGTNPLLVSSTGMLIVILMYSFIPRGRIYPN